MMKSTRAIFDADFESAISELERLTIATIDMPRPRRPTGDRCPARPDYRPKKDQGSKWGQYLWSAVEYLRLESVP